MLASTFSYASMPSPTASSMHESNQGVSARGGTAGPVLLATCRHLDATTATTAALGQPGQAGPRTKHCCPRLKPVLLLAWARGSLFIQLGNYHPSGAEKPLENMD